jgi:hypothetical protein
MSTHASSPKALPTVLAPCRRKYESVPLMTPKAVAFDDFIAERNFWLEDAEDFARGLTKSTADDRAKTLHHRQLFVAALRTGVFRRLSFHTYVDVEDHTGATHKQLTRTDSFVHVASGRRVNVNTMKDIVRGKTPAPREPRPRGRPVDPRKTAPKQDSANPRVKAVACISRANFDAAKIALQARLDDDREEQALHEARLAWHGDLARALHAGHNRQHLLNGNWNQPSADAAPVATAHYTHATADCPPPAEYKPVARPRLMPAPHAATRSCCV